MNRQKIKIILIVIIVACIIIGVISYVLINRYLAGKEIYNQIQENQETFIKHGFKETVMVIDSRSDSFSENSTGKRILRSDLAKYIKNKVNRDFIFPDKLPDDLVWGDINISDDIIMFSIGYKKNIPENFIDMAETYFDVDEAKLFVKEQITKPQQWEEILIFDREKFNIDNISVVIGRNSEKGGLNTVFFNDNLFISFRVLSLDVELLNHQELRQIAESFIIK